jgi:hypothetical protein
LKNPVYIFLNTPVAQTGVFYILQRILTKFICSHKSNDKITPNLEALAHPVGRELLKKS